MSMEKHQLDSMVNGWFVGAFSPTALKTDSVEVAVKKYSAGANEQLHHHRVATEVTLVLAGSVKMNGQIHAAGDILVIKPGEATDFAALTDVTTVVVKVPGALNDKYLGEQGC
jgi:hypothetical protein